MREIPLTRGYVAIVDDVDYDVLAAFKWRALVQGGAENRRVYAVRDGARMHRDVWKLWHGAVPEGDLDHIEPGAHGGLDNRRSNLRLTTKSRNQANRRKGRNNTSGYKGVWWQQQVRRWRVDIWINRKKHHIGYFDDKVAAARAYDAAALAAHGEHARLNFPNGEAA